MLAFSITHAQVASNAENVSIWWRHDAFLSEYCDAQYGVYN